MDINHVLATYGGIIELVLYLTLSVLLFFKTKDISYIKEIIMDIKNDGKLNFNSASTYQENSKKTKFESVIPVYKLNKATGLLEKTDDFVDLQDVLNSYKDVALNNVLAKFLPTFEDEANTIFDASMQVADDLDEMQYVFDLAEDYREKLNLSKDLTTAEIFETVKKYKNNIDNRIKEIQDEKKKNEQEKE